MGTERKPPQSAQELLERYAAGERWFPNMDLGDANLAGANLAGAKLTGANLLGADFAGANLDAVDLNSAELASADLAGANLAGADLSRADLSDANLRRANLSGADAFCTILTNADLTGANLGGLTLEFTLLVDLDLTPFCDADPPVVHHGPSTVDFSAIVKSLRSRHLKAFLQRTGMHEVVIKALMMSARHLQNESPGMLLSTFISYGGPDEAFARRLNGALHENGVTTFFFPEHAVPGKKIGRAVRECIKNYDRVVLVCSKNGLDRAGVLHEIEEIVDRERREGGAELVIPVLLDDHLLSGWHPPHPDVAVTLRERVAADFRGWDADPVKFEAGLRKLILALKK